MPAAVLIFVVLGALALDTTVVFLAERELAGAAAAAANDAATRAIDEGSFYDDGCVVLAADAVVAVVEASVADKALSGVGINLAPPEVRVDGARVTVTLRAQAPHVFTSALPGGSPGAAVSATASATARRARGVSAGC